MRIFVDRVQIDENRMALMRRDDDWQSEKNTGPVIILEEEDGPYWDLDPEDQDRVWGIKILDAEGNSVAAVRYHNRRPGGYSQVWVEVYDASQTEVVEDYWPDEKGEQGHD